MALLGKRHFANIYDNRGDFVSTIHINSKEKTFDWRKKSYNIDILNSSIFLKKGYLMNKYYIDYNIDNPNPILKLKKTEPILNSELYNIMLKTKVAKDLNEIPSEFLSKLLTPRNLLIGGGIAVGIYYFYSGGKLW